MDPLKGKRPTTITARQLVILRHFAEYKSRKGRAALRYRLGLTAQEYEAEFRQALYCALVAENAPEKDCVHLIVPGSVVWAARIYLSSLPTMDDPLF